MKKSYKMVNGKVMMECNNCRRYRMIADRIPEWMLAQKLMEAYNQALYLNDMEVCNKIKEAVNSLNLPDFVCDSCKEVKMSTFDYILRQGMCSVCAKKYSEEPHTEVE